ncbi:MAG: glycine cleavage system protein GcvH [Chloroflexi bacterium]|mgnify:CR=1 FL=1|jgi:glycine cleavage system H protein|nr:glycine cleavage system protein GcvH [Chloroflexota bacterium]
MASNINQDCLYSQSHEWVRVEGDTAYAGITDYAQSQLSDIVYVELPEVGTTYAQGDNFAVVESVKAASDCYLSLSGEIIEVNEALESEPELVNSDPYGKGWFVRLAIADASEIEGLMSPSDYAEFVAKAEEEGGH